MCAILICIRCANAIIGTQTGKSVKTKSDIETAGCCNRSWESVGIPCTVSIGNRSSVKNIATIRHTGRGKTKDINLNIRVRSAFSSSVPAQFVNHGSCAVFSSKNAVDGS